MIRRPPRSTQSRSSAASDVYKRQARRRVRNPLALPLSPFLLEREPHLHDEYLVEKGAVAGFLERLGPLREMDLMDGLGDIHEAELAPHGPGKGIHHVTVSLERAAHIAAQHRRGDTRCPRVDGDYPAGVDCLRGGVRALSAQNVVRRIHHLEAVVLVAVSYTHLR